MLSFTARRSAQRWSGDEAASPDLGEVEPVLSLPTTPRSFLWGFVRSGYLSRYGVMVLMVIAGTLCDTLEPYLLKRLINQVGPAAGKGIVTEDILRSFAILALVWIGAVGFFRIYQMIDIYTGPSLRALVQNRLFGYLLGHSPRYFQENFAGRLGQKIKEAAKATLVLLEMTTFDMTRLTVLLVGAGILLATQAGFYAGVLGAWAAIYLVLSTALAYRCVILSRAMSAAWSTSSGKLIDAISNAETVRGFARWRHEREFLDGYFGVERSASMRLRWFLVLMRSFQGVGVLSMLGILVWLAVRDTIAGTMDIGGFTMTFTLASLIAMNVWNLSNRMLEFFEQLGTLTEALELVTAPHEITNRPAAPALVVGGGRIEFDRVDFAHPDGTKLFDAFSLTIEPGEKIGLVGPSGAGKSTLVKLLRRQYEPEAGRILIDGQDIAQVEWDSVNEAIAEVSQSPGIFHRPVGENIRYGRLDADEQAVVGAARQAYCHDFIQRRPMGYGTIVGEQGLKLSGGERQRVAIARAMLKDARILVLDEATSALDSESEHQIQQALWELMQGRTVIAIAHRLSTITGMDRILYMHHGRILEQGRHEELISRDGPYARLWNRQVGGFLGAA